MDEKLVPLVSEISLLGVLNERQDIAAALGIFVAAFNVLEFIPIMILGSGPINLLAARATH